MTPGFDRLYNEMVEGVRLFPVDELFALHADWKMNGRRLKDVAADPGILEGTDDYDTILHFVEMFSNRGMRIEDFIALDRKNIVYDGFHRLVAAKIAGLKNVYAKNYDDETQVDRDAAEMEKR